MKKATAILLILGIALSLAACGGKADNKANKMEGEYFLTTITVDDFRMPPSEKEAVSFVQVTEYGGNNYCMIAIFMGDLSSYLDGYLSQGDEYGDAIRYKYHVTSNVGDFVSSDTDWFYLYYYPADDTVEIIGGGDTSFEFSKK